MSKFLLRLRSAPRGSIRAYGTSLDPMTGELTALPDVQVCICIYLSTFLL